MLGQQETQTPLFAYQEQLKKLYPSNHILAKVDKVLDLTWLESEVKHLYSESMGRPSIPPESIARIMIAGILLGIVGDRKLEREAQTNYAIRCFAMIGLEKEPPDHSTLTRVRELWGEEIFETLFKRVLEDCQKAGLVGKSTIHVDSTLIRANASIESVVKEYMDDVNKANKEGSREEQKDVVEEQRDEVKEVQKKDVKKAERKCLTDPDATMARKNRKDKFEPRYKAHVAVDDEHGVVVDVRVTTGCGSESRELVEQVQRVEENIGARPERITADAGYSSGENYRQLEEMGIEPFIVPKKEAKRGKCFPVQRFKYNNVKQIVKCLAGKVLRRSYRDSSGWFYTAKVSDCRACRLKTQCVSKSQNRRKLHIIDGYDGRLRAWRRKIRQDEQYTEAMKRHRWMIEGRHAEAKVVHGMARAQRRGLEQVSIQVYLTAMVMNLKRLVASAFLKLLRLYRGFSRTLQLPRNIFLSLSQRSARTPRDPYPRRQAGPFSLFSAKQGPFAQGEKRACARAI